MGGRVWLSRVLIELGLMASPWAYGVMAVTILIDVYLLYVFFTRRSWRRRARAAARIELRRRGARLDPGNQSYPRGEVRRAGTIVSAAFYWLVLSAFRLRAFERGCCG